MVIDLEQFLSYFFQVSGDGNTNSSSEANHNVSISKPTISRDVAVDMLKCQFDWVVGIVYVEQHQTATSNYNTDLHRAP